MVKEDDRQLKLTGFGDGEPRLPAEKGTMPHRLGEILNIPNGAERQEIITDIISCLKKPPANPEAESQDHRPSVVFNFDPDGKAWLTTFNPSTLRIETESCPGREGVPFGIGEAIIIYHQNKRDEAQRTAEVLSWFMEPGSTIILCQKNWQDNPVLDRKETPNLTEEETIIGNPPYTIKTAKTIDKRPPLPLALEGIDLFKYLSWLGAWLQTTISEACEKAKKEGFEVSNIAEITGRLRKSKNPKRDIIKMARKVPFRLVKIGSGELYQYDENGEIIPCPNQPHRQSSGKPPNAVPSWFRGV